MPRQQTIRRRVSNGPWQEFTVTYLDDSAERSEAVSFFQKLERGLFPAISPPDIIDELPLTEAQRYLDAHPVQEQWNLLTLAHADDVADEDLARLEQIPELKMLKIMSDRITDRGIQHLKWLTELTTLILYSKNVADACLEFISQCTSLEAVDMQVAPNVTRAAYFSAMDRLPNLRDRYPPFVES